MSSLSDLDHPTIYLEPGSGDPLTGREWSQHGVWSDNPDYGGAAPARYVRADLVEALRVELDQLRAERQKHDTPAWEANERLNETVERLCEEIGGHKAEIARLRTVLREPTEAMVSAGAKAGDVGRYTAHLVFDAMIDAALAPNRT